MAGVCGREWLGCVGENPGVHRRVHDCTSEQMTRLHVWVQTIAVTSENPARFFRTVKSRECYWFCG